MDPRYKDTNLKPLTLLPTSSLSIFEIKSVFLTSVSDSVLECKMGLVKGCLRNIVYIRDLNPNRAQSLTKKSLLRSWDCYVLIITPYERCLIRVKLCWDLGMTSIFNRTLQYLLKNSTFSTMFYSCLFHVCDLLLLRTSKGLKFSGVMSTQIVLGLPLTFIHFWY